VKLGRAIPGTALFFALVGCSGSGEPGSASPHVVEHRPPSRKDVIEAVLASEAVKLTVHSSCMGVGTEATDDTIGAFLSGFLAEFENGGSNWLETSVVEAQSEAGVAVWRAEVIVRHSALEDEWGWGVRFDVRRADGVVDPESFLCIGAG
jgi:hypothetical protein